LVTGGNDSQVILWKDCSKEETEAEKQEKEELIKQEQDLDNSIFGKDLAKAFKLALVLDKPGKLMGIITSLVKNENSYFDVLAPVVSGLSDKHLDRLMKYCSSWNSHSKNSILAQRIINCVLSSYPPDRLASLYEFRHNLAGMVSYTERHVRRIEKLNAQATFINFITQTSSYTTAIKQNGDNKAVESEESADESISEDESPVEHKISISALVTSLKEMQPKRKIPKRNKDIFAEWGHVETKKVEEKVEEIVKKPKMKKKFAPKVMDQMKVVHENMDTESEETAIREYCISEPEIPKVPKSTPVKKKKGRTLTDSNAAPKSSSKKTIINKAISETGSVESISTPTRRSSRLKK
jgi:U3 small nucleolar RNA-associated protein 13